MPWRLLVIDGADQGSVFPLADASSVVVATVVSTPTFA